VRRALRLITNGLVVTTASAALAVGAGALNGYSSPAPTEASVPVLPMGVTIHPPVGMEPPPPPPCAPGVQACVRLSTSQAWLIPPGGKLIGPVPIGYGVGAHATPTGTWPVSWKAEAYVSRTYHEPMPDAVFFAPGGIAFHAGSLDTSSHGCVHLDPGTAAQFFATLQPGALVQIVP
jgi:hypothetical protein